MFLSPEMTSYLFLSNCSSCHLSWPPPTNLGIAEVTCPAHSSRLLPQGLAFDQPSKKESQLGLRDVQPVSSRVKKSKICFYLSESLSPNQGSSICTSCPEPGRQLFQGFLSPKLHLIKF